MRESFRANYPDVPLVPTGGLLNKVAGKLNAGTGLGDGGEHYGPFDAKIGLPPFIFGVATITNASNDCDPELEQGGYDAPCQIHGTYKAKFRSYDFNRAKWLPDFNTDTGEDLQEYRLTTGGYHYGVNDFGAIPVYQVGDVIPCFLDTQRGWLVPISTPPDQNITAEFTGTLDPVPRLSYQCDTGEWIMEVNDPSLGDGWNIVSFAGGFFQAPPCDDTQLSFSYYATFGAKPGNKIRFRFGGPDLELSLTMQARFQAVGRRRFGDIRADIIGPIGQPDGIEGPGQYYKNFRSVRFQSEGLISTTAGLYKDSPGFVIRNIDLDNFIEFQTVENNANELWVCYVHFKFTLTRGNLSSSSSSTSDSSQSSSASSSSTSESSSQSSVNSSSSSTSSVNSSSSSTSSVNSSSSSTSTAAQESSSGYDCHRFLTGVVFNPATCVLTWCYKYVCFPESLGVIVSDEVCV